MKTIGFLGFGEASFNIAEGLRDEGLTGIRAYDASWQREPYGTIVRERAEHAGVTLESSADDLIANVDIVVCSISANMAVTVAQQSVAALRQDQIYVDLNSAGPDTKVEVDRIISPHATFVDVAVMGTVPGNRHKVPMLAAGKGAKEFADYLNGFGAKVTVLEGPAGKASASKMFRSIFMKGYVMLLLEAVIAGRKFGLEDDVLASIRDTISGGDFLRQVNDMIARGVIHAERREHEMDEVIATLKSLDVDATMSVATKNKLAWCVSQGFREHFNAQPPADYHEIFAVIAD